MVIQTLKLSSRIYFEDHDKVRKVRDEIISCMKKQLSFEEVHEEGMCDVKIALCPIVSRAGTDIEAALSRNSGCSAEKLTIMMVLHHTFNSEAMVPSSSRYDKKNLLMVDVLFHEDKGFLECTRNEEALNKIADYLTCHCAQTPEPKAPVSASIKFLYFFRDHYRLFIGVTLFAGGVFCIYNWPHVKRNMQDFIHWVESLCLIKHLYIKH